MVGKGKVIFLFKKIAKYVLLVAVLLCCSFLAFGIVDYNRFFAGEEPIFIVKCDVLNDGGTKIYYGIGYQLIDWKKIDSTDIKNINYLVGKECHFFTQQIDPKDGPEIELKKENLE